MPSVTSMATIECLHCSCDVPREHVSHAASKPSLLVARSVQCETKYILQSSGGAIRRALFRVERGVCVRCKADCRALVLRLRAVEKGSRDWEGRRRALIVEYAPRHVSFC